MLMERLREKIGYKVGLRLGGLIRDETEETVIHFVTTGYLVKKCSCLNSMFFKNMTHMIIDEVHERTAMGDILCFYSRKLLKKYLDLKVILMSATPDTKLYEQYYELYGRRPFNVGQRRYEIEFISLEDLLYKVQNKNTVGLDQNCVAKNKDFCYDIENCIRLTKNNASGRMVRIFFFP